MQGTLVAMSLMRLRAAVQSWLGPPAGAAFVLITALQFHLPFYASRTLPNVFALATATLAHADWLAGGRPLRAVALLAFTTVSSETVFPSRKVPHHSRSRTPPTGGDVAACAVR